ncbi:hypothetical protein [Sphingomonas sp. TX0522]|uniref:hypothetical protein n=1 Tax=Sphingomonas sp. TX0522 TaxID=2479205 RepID=UPI0018DFEBA7|nr:hypothetical protein [Sphingomonas sp. TX0522]MBI0530332.1 hypothetical protein [Sphingomonas sp. TX0522]
MSSDTLTHAPRAVRLVVARALLGEHAVNIGNARRRDRQITGLGAARDGFVNGKRHAGARS